MTRSLVVGASGYVGRELSRHLAGRGDDVWGLGRSPQPRRLPGRWIQADITCWPELKAALSGQAFDVVFHAASLPGDTGDPRQMVDVNITGLTNMLVLARDMGPHRFVLTSSISALEWYPGTKFSPPDYMPVDEEHPARPRDMYSSTKRMQEILALTFYHQYGLPVTVLRLTGVVGPEGRGGGRSYRVFAEKMREGKRIQIPHFSMDEVCHYVDYRDVARMHAVVGDHPAAVGEIFNCVGRRPTSGSEFAAAVQRVVPGIEVEVGFPWSQSQGGQIAFDMSKAKRVLGFVPEYDIEDSLRALKQWADAGGLEEDAPASDASFSAGVGTQA
jgi:nucleoside-diphosphate-sugar epimerase